MDVFLQSSWEIAKAQLSWWLFPNLFEEICERQIRSWNPKKNRGWKFQQKNMLETKPPRMPSWEPKKGHPTNHCHLYLPKK